MDVWANITRMQESVRYESFRNKGVAREKIVVAYEDMVAGRMTDLESYPGVTLPSDMSSVNLGPFGYTKRSGASGNWRAVFPEEDVKILRLLIGDTLDDALYHDWAHSPQPAPKPDYKTRRHLL